MNRTPAQSLDVTLGQLVQPILGEKGIELVELSISGNARRYVLRFFVDRPDGISIGECAQLSRELADVLDTYDPIDASYTLEVSSPGLTRPIKTRKDFERASGKAIRVITSFGHDHVGKLIDVSDEAIELEVEGETMSVALTNITKANLHFQI
ncbi:TPA: ribosome maturation factor RimP [Candidatus Latescibacteria bacterium]|nr:ribosome maturation factor RimP [Candidatus Latescibacterota bacterium]